MRKGLRGMVQIVGHRHGQVVLQALNVGDPQAVFELFGPGDAKPLFSAAADRDQAGLRRFKHRDRRERADAVEYFGSSAWAASRSPSGR